MKSKGYSIAFLLLWALLWPAELLANDANYRVIFDSSTGLMQVQACFAKAIPNTLSTGSRRASAISEVKQGAKTLRIRDNRVKLNTAGHHCVTYRANIAQLQSRRQTLAIGETWVINTQSWLLRPSILTDLQLRIVDKQNRPLKVMTPWPETAGVYRVGPTPAGWSSRMVIGDFQQRRIAVGEQTLAVTLVAQSQTEQQKLLAWLKEATQVTQLAHGKLPLDEVNVLLVPLGPQGEPIPWAEVQRGGQPFVHYFIDPKQPLSAFRDDWTGIHELSHLFLPKMHWRDRWVSEGIASYYQNLLRGRSSLLTQEQGWNKLRAGFLRGESAADTPIVSARKTMSVYWGGAAYFMLADLQLRQQGKDLGHVLGQLKHCCLPSDDSWRASELAQKLDELSQTTIFSQLLAKEMRQRRFPIPRSMLSTNPNKDIAALFTPVEKTGLTPSTHLTQSAR